MWPTTNNLSYQLQVDQLLRNNLADKNQQSQARKGLKQLLDKL
ncbi:MAG: hypothetical protein ACSLEM_04875 [Candidatus Malihini olakiniferum]